MKLIIGLILVLFLAGCVELFEVSENDACKTDADCVPATCCHADSCVNVDNKPDCEGIMCTMACISVLDCQQGTCVCKNNKCAVEIIEG